MDISVSILFFLKLIFCEQIKKNDEFGSRFDFRITTFKCKSGKVTSNSTRVHGVKHFTCILTCGNIHTCKLTYVHACVRVRNSSVYSASSCMLIAPATQCKNGTSDHAARPCAPLPFPGLLPPSCPRGTPKYIAGLPRGEYICIYNIPQISWLLANFRLMKLSNGL